MSMLADPWRMAIPNPDEVLNGAFAIDGSLSVRGIYADEIRLRQGSTYNDFLTTIGSLADYGDLTAIIKGLWGVTTETGVDWNIIKRAADVKIANAVTAKDATLNLVKLTLKGAEGDVRPGYNALERIAGPLRHIYWSRQALPSMEPEQYRRDREEFFAWFDHFKVNIRALSADRTGETPETTGGGRIPTAPDVLPDRSDWAKTQNWALKDHFHDERYALVKHPHVKADITDWAHRHPYDDIIGGPKVPGGEGMDKVAGLATSTAIFGGALIVGGIKYYKDRKGFVRQIDELNARPPIKFDTEDAQREYYKLENEKQQWSELKDKEMTEVAEKKAEANKLMTDAQRQEESALTALRSAERQVAEERTKMILEAEEELKRINEQREAAKAKKLQEIEALTAGTELLEAQRKEIEDRKKKLEKEAEARRQLLEEEEETRRKAGELQTGAVQEANRLREEIKNLKEAAERADEQSKKFKANADELAQRLLKYAATAEARSPMGTAETQTTPRPDPRPAAERLPFARLGRSDQVEELIGLTLEDQRALFDALEQRRRADEEAVAKTEEERLKAMQTASDEEFARLEEPKVAGRKRALEAFKNNTLDAMGAKMRELKRNESRNGEKIRALGVDIRDFTYVMNQLTGRGQKDAEELRRKMADEKWKNFERAYVQRYISDAIWIAYGDAEEMHRELRTEASLWRGGLEWSMYGMYKREFLAELRANPKTVSGAQSAYVGMINYVEKLSKFWEKRRAVIPAEGLAQYDAMVRDLEAFKREHPPAKYKLYIDTTAFIGELRKRGDEAKSQIEERYRKAQADKEYANRVIEERKQQAKENAARRNAEIEEQRRKIAERKAAEEEARKTKVETEYQALKREANQILKRRGRAYADEGAGVGLASPDDITLAERDDVSVEEMRPGTARLPSEGVFQTLDRRVMGDSDVILRNALMPYGDWNRATADALADFDLERFTTKEQRDAYLGRPRARRPGRFISGAGIDLVGAGLGGTGSRAMRRAGAAAAGLGLATAGGLLSAYQALSQGKIGEAEFFDTFRDQMIMTVGSFGLQTGMSSALSALTKMRIGTVGGLGLSILAGAIAQVIVDIINGRSAEEIVKNFFKYPVDWAADTIQFIAQLSQQIYDWGVETWGDEASQLRNRINRLEGELGSGFVGVYDPSEAREMASLLAQELRLNEIKEPKELQAFIRALDNSINDYRTPKDQKTLLEIDRATVLFLSQLTVKMQEGFGSTSLALSRLMRDLKQMVKEETKGRKRVLIAVYQEGLNRINHIEALRREFGSAIRHSGVSSNGGAQVARLADANSRLEIPGTFRMQDWWEAEAFRNYGAFIDNGINSQSPKANWLVPKAYVDKLVDRPAAPYTKKIAKGIEYWAPEPGQPVFASQNYEWHMAPGASQAVSTVGVAVPQLAAVAHTGEYQDLKGRPTIPTIPATWAWGNITGKPSTYPHADHQHTISEISDWTAPDLSNITVDWETQVTGRPATFPPSTHSHNVDWETQVTGKPLTFPPSTHSHTEYSLTGHGHRNVNMDAYITHGTSFHSYAAYTEFNINSTYTVTFNITFGQAYDTGGGLGTPANPTPVINVTPSFDINPGGSTDVDFYGANVTALFIHWTAIGKLLM
eukprot:tig00000144_g9132.t1